MTEPRRHHLVPRFYLDGFAPGGKLHVFDYSTGKRYTTSPAKACRETDFFRLNDDGRDSQLMEKILAEHESTVAPYIQQVAADGRVCEKRQVGEALALAAAISARNRRGRAQLETAVRPRIIKALRAGTVTEAEWERHRLLELANGAPEDDVPPYEEARAKAVAGGWMPRAPRALIIDAIPHAQEALMKLLQRRHWEAHVTDANRNGGFITSDSPLVWGELDAWIAGHRASLATPGIEITFPVSKDVALVSNAEARDGNVEATDDIVAHINARTLFGSTGIVMYPHDNFLVQPNGDRMRRSRDYFAYQDDARRRGIIHP